MSLNFLRTKISSRKWEALIFKETLQWTLFPLCLKSNAPELELSQPFLPRLITGTKKRNLPPTSHSSSTNRYALCLHLTKHYICYKTEFQAIYLKPFFSLNSIATLIQVLSRLFGQKAKPQGLCICQPMH